MQYLTHTLRGVAFAATLGAALSPVASFAQDATPVQQASIPSPQPNPLGMHELGVPVFGPTIQVPR